jgi:hypothetical protein
MSFANLPTELVLMVLKNLDTKDVWAVERTARRMRTLALWDIRRRMNIITACWQFKVGTSPSVGKE